MPDDLDRLYEQHAAALDSQDFDKADAIMREIFEHCALSDGSEYVRLDEIAGPNAEYAFASIENNWKH